MEPLDICLSTEQNEFLEDDKSLRLFPTEIQTTKNNNPINKTPKKKKSKSKHRHTDHTH